MLRMFIPTSNGKISRRRYIFSFILINFIFAFLIIFFNDGEAGFLVIVSIILLHYLVINLNCQRLRDSGFVYIKTYVDSRRFCLFRQWFDDFFNLLFFHFQYANACTY